VITTLGGPEQLLFSQGTVLLRRCKELFLRDWILNHLDDAGTIAAEVMRAWQAVQIQGRFKRRPL